MRFLVRSVGFLVVAAGFVVLVLDGARSIANAQLMVTPLGETMMALLRERYLAIQPALERNLHPMLWDPVAVNVLRAPTALVALALGFLLLWLGRRPPERIGILTRR